MSPIDFQKTRKESNSPASCYEICGRPYFPHLIADPKSTDSIAEVASKVILQQLKVTSSAEIDLAKTSVSKVTGGITNALFRVSNFEYKEEKESLSQLPSSVLVRIFGAEGMIDRDIETCAYAALCDAGVAYQFLGRFGNGRLEGWLDGFVPLPLEKMSDPLISRKLAKELALLHKSFDSICTDDNKLKTYFSRDKPGMWDQLFQWLDQAQQSIQKEAFINGLEDVKKAHDLILTDAFNVEQELNWLRKDVVPTEAEVVFCHNDLLCDNIMIKEKESNELEIQMIDFEYGGSNFAAFDIANHFNEFAGGTDNGIPNYGLFPDKEAQYNFVKTYLECKQQTGDNDAIIQKDQVETFMEEVHSFVLANHLYWGLWAVNQAAAEGCDDFNYLLYAENRFKEYRNVKN